MDALDLSAFLSLVVGVTQIVKSELELRKIKLGNWSRLLAFFLGGAGVYVMAYYPHIWDTLVPIFLMFAGPGGVSLLNDLKKKRPA